MEKEIIILAMSEKYCNLCVAGIDIKNGEWIRPISKDTTIHGAVPEKDIVYENSENPKILDTVKIKFESYSESYHQKENFIYDKNYYWHKTGQISKNDLVKYISKNSYIFYNSKSFVTPDIIEKISKNNRYSLMLIRPSETSVIVKTFPEKRKVTLCIQYNGERYNYIPVTDKEFKNLYLQKRDGTYSLNNVLLVMSLGELHTDGKYYKLVATVIKP